MSINGIAANYYQMGYTNNEATKADAGKSFVEIASQKVAESDKESTQEKTSAVLELIGANAPDEVRQAWTEAEKEMGGWFTVGGSWVSADGKHSFMTQMGVQIALKWAKGELDQANLLGNSVQSAINAVEKWMYDFDHPLAGQPARSVEEQKLSMNERKFYETFLEKLKHLAGQEQTTFTEKVAETGIASQSVLKTRNVGTVSTEDMTMEEYKQYIYDKISQMTINPSRMQDNISINISEAGFKAMKNDPEYEKWVLDYLQKDFNCYNPWTATNGGCYCVKYIGATKEEYRGESWYAGYQNGKGKSLYDEKSQDSFWERRAERRQRLKEEYEELLEKRALANRFAQEQYYRSSIAKAAASASYESNVLTEPVESGGFASAMAGTIV